MEIHYRLHSASPLLSHPHAWAEIDLSALRANYRALCGAVQMPNRKIRPIAVVKADAYGHGAPACVRALVQEGCDCFAVSCMEEAVAVRQVCRAVGCGADVLILGYTDPKHAKDLAEQDLLQTVLSLEYAARLQEEAARAGVLVRVHIALDTGMNRIGLPARNDEEIQLATEAVFSMRACENLQIEGLYTHFSRADEAADGTAFAAVQARRFQAVKNGLEMRGSRIPLCHVCNSAGALLRPTDEWLFGGVRFGIALYGASPSEWGGPLSPVMRLRTAVVHIHSVSAGDGVGYGAAWKAAGNRTIATLPIGYADGFLRKYSGATVSLETANGIVRAPVVGRVCMDQCMLDVTGAAVHVGDAVTIFGNDPRELLALAERADTIGYEVLCAISARVPRIYSEC